MFGRQGWSIGSGAMETSRILGDGQILELGPYPTPGKGIRDQESSSVGLLGRTRREGYGVEGG